MKWHTNHRTYTLTVRLETPSNIYTWSGDPLDRLSDHMLNCYDLEIHIQFTWR